MRHGDWYVMADCSEGRERLCIDSLAVCMVRRVKWSTRRVHASFSALLRSDVYGPTLEMDLRSRLVISRQHPGRGTHTRFLLDDIAVRIYVLFIVWNCKS